MKDSNEKPLFNKNAWLKAKRVLREILAGNCADLPFCEYYTQRQTKQGAIARGKYGIPLLDCERGTNITENVHKQIIATFGSWHVGVEMVSTKSVPQ